MTLRVIGATTQTLVLSSPADTVVYAGDDRFACYGLSGTTVQLTGAV